MTSKALTPGTYGKAQPWHVQMVAQADARKAALMRRSADAQQSARHAALSGASSGTLMMMLATGSAQLP